MKVCIVHKGQGGQADCQQNGPPLAETLQNLQKNEYLLLPYNFTIPSPLTSTSTFITPAPPSQPHSALYPLSSSSLPHCFFSPNSSLPPLVLSPLHTSQESIYPSWLLLLSWFWAGTSFGPCSPMACFLKFTICMSLSLLQISTNGRIKSPFQY